MVKQLLPALYQAKKIQQLDKVLQLILDSLELRSDPVFANEVRGACHIIT